MVGEAGKALGTAPVSSAVADRVLVLVGRLPLAGISALGRRRMLAGVERHLRSALVLIRRLVAPGRSPPEDPAGDCGSGRLVGLDYLQNYQLTGCVMATVGETQYRWTQLIQVSDLAGSHGITLIVVFAAACVARMIPTGHQQGAPWPAALAAEAVTAALLYGHLQMAGLPGTPEARFALIQDCVDVQTKADATRREAILTRYISGFLHAPSRTMGRWT